MSVNKTSVSFSKHFRQKFPVGDYVCVFVREDGCVCFKFYDTPESGAFKVTEGKYDAKFFRIPLYLREGLPIGHYNVVQEDGYFVSDCKAEI